MRKQNQSATEIKSLTPKETAKLLKISLPAVYLYAKQGKIPHVRINGCLRFDYNDILAWWNKAKRGVFT